jgi:dipeptidase D
MTFVADLEPKALWKHFDEILKIPRASKHEGRIRDYVIAVAERNGLSHRQDSTGNVVVKKPGMSGHEKTPISVLQAHMDMVQQNNSDVNHDWEKDPIVPRQENGYLCATGTTLGSDNGIGLAAMLAVMEAEDLVHGPLEFLFTVDEETGLTGASGLGDDLLEGRQLINMDSEEEGVLTVGCAGGADSHVFVPLSSIDRPAGSFSYTVNLRGLKGGHSGIDIQLQRGNATKLLARALHMASYEARFLLSDIRGGNAHNAIPREASATVVVDGGSTDTFRSSLEHELAAIRSEFASVEPRLAWEISAIDAPEKAWDEQTTARVLNLLTALPHGVVSMSYDIPGLVETSTNLAVVAPTDGKLKIWMSSRSSVASAIEAVRRRIRAAAALAGCEITEGGGYPGWKPDMDSRLLAVVRQLHVEVLGSEPEVGAVHAGLECGIIGEKYDGMDMISFGPQIEFPHSPDERVHIESVERFYRLLLATLEKLA